MKSEPGAFSKSDTQIIKKIQIVITFLLFTISVGNFHFGVGEKSVRQREELYVYVEDIFF